MHRRSSNLIQDRRVWIKQTTNQTDIKRCYLVWK